MSIEKLIKNKLLNKPEESENILKKLKYDTKYFNNSAQDLLIVDIKDDIIEVSNLTLFASKSENILDNRVKIEAQTSGNSYEISHQKALELLNQSISEEPAPYNWISVNKDKLDIKKKDNKFLIDRNKLSKFLSSKKKNKMIQ